jgi:CheY-like chemotaxis protein
MKKVLIIEDHPDMRELLSWQVELMGFTAVLAQQGREGIDKAVTEKPDLIILDIMMPGMDGREAAREIRAKPELKDVTILASTALFREVDLKACIEAGCNGYIVKPFTFQELQAKLQELAPSLNPNFPR